MFVVDETGKNLGEMPNYEALNLARSKGLDLVEVSPNAKIPVCKITDYGKFQYIKTKQTRIASAKQKKVELKGVRIGLKTGRHDLDFKKKQTEKFLSKGHKVKIEMILKGREKAHQELAKNNLKEFADNISIPYRIEESLKRSPRGFDIIIAPE
ncbi:translation initiation factor IF-3 [bacterium]|nr:translation initiation factor IF-3 [bacterium]